MLSNLLRYPRRSCSLSPHQAFESRQGAKDTRSRIKIQKKSSGVSVMSAASGKRFDPDRISDYADRLAAWAEGKGWDAPDPRPARPTDRREGSSATQPDHDGEGLSAPPARGDAQERAAQGHAADERAADESQWRSEAPDDSTDEWAGDAAAQREGAGGDASLQNAVDTRMAAYEVDLQQLEEAFRAARERESDESGSDESGSDESESDESGSDESGYDESESDESASRWPPASRAPRGFRPPDDARTDDLSFLHAAEPSYEPLPPMRARTSHLGSVLRVLAACAVAAPIAYVVLNYYGAANELLTAVRGWAFSAVETRTAALPSTPAARPDAAPPLRALQASQPSRPQPPPQPGPSYQVQSAAPAWTAPRQAGGAATAPANPAASLAASPASPPAPSLALAPPAAPTAHPAPAMDRAEIAMLLKQGDQFISVGDVATARMLFERAAEAGDGKAALALAATYDPAVLAKLGARGIAPDAEKSRRWYEKARELGSPEAPTWLARLAGR